MKNRSSIITLITILGVLVVFLVLGMFFLLGTDYNMSFNIGFFSEQVNDKVYEETFDNKYDLIDVESSMGDVQFKSTTDEKIKVVIYSKKDQYSVDESDTKLHIETSSEKCTFFCFNVKSDKVVVYLPKDYAQKIEILNRYGDIDIGSFKDATINVKADCGDIRIDNANNTEIVNKYGDISLGKVEKAKIVEDCGDVKIGTVSNVDISNKYGDIKIGTVNKYIKANNNCGDISIGSLNITRNSSIKDDLGDIKIDDTNDIYIDAKTSLGDTDVNKSNRNAKTELVIKNNCGDIKVNN